jgi:hypothetical protein
MPQKAGWSLRQFRHFGENKDLMIMLGIDPKFFCDAAAA